MSSALSILHTESSLGWGGQEIRIISEAAGLESRGHEVTLAASPHSRVYDEAKSRGLTVVAAPIERKGLRGLWGMRRVLAAQRFDVVNTHSSTDSWLAALAARTLRRPPPLVRTRHISAPVADNAATRWLYRTATCHVVTTGETLRRGLIGGQHLPEDHVSSVPTGVNIERFSPGDRADARRALGLPQDIKLVGIVATLRSWKGHRYLIEAISMLARRDLGLVVVGDGPQRDALAALAQEKGLKRFWMTGNQADVIPWLQAFNIFALPSYANEGVPQALVQAMLCGLPCVTTNVGAIGEAAIDGRTALVVAPRDAKALAFALQRLADDAELCVRLGMAARAHCTVRFNIEVMLDRMEGIFRAAAAR
jgi:glycosyltransferase involved in cell wall biosynthesis